MNTPLVYILECDNFTKIGFTRNSIEDRIRNFQHGNPHKITLHSVYMSDNAFSLEKYLHIKFKEFNIRGEWFSLSDEEKAKIPLYVYESKLT